jgi:uncharacterized protein YukE
LPELGAYEDPVEFDWEAATRLAAELRSAATLLKNQIPSRNALAASARKDWRGTHAEQFDGRMRICASDARRFATELLHTAVKVEELAKLAREEQRRRDLAKEWKRKHDEWQRRRDARSKVDKIGDWITEDVGWGDSDEPLPPDPPKSVKVHTSDPPPPAKR